MKESFVYLNLPSRVTSEPLQMLRLWPVIQNVEEDWWSPWVFFVAATVFSLTIGWVIWRIRFSLSSSSIYLYVIFIGVVFVWRKQQQQQQKKGIPTIHNTHHISSSYTFFCMHTYDDAKLSLWNRERHILISFSLQLACHFTGSYTPLMLYAFLQAV